MENWSDLFPLIFLPFKLIVLGIGMYYAIKWHYDREQEKKEEEAAAQAEAQALAQTLSKPQDTPSGA